MTEITNLSIQKGEGEMRHSNSWQPFTIAVLTLLGICLGSSALFAADKPNIRVIMSDDVGITNISAYSRGSKVMFG
jgi:hypothetical protein